MAENYYHSGGGGAFFLKKRLFSINILDFKKWILLLNECTVFQKNGYFF